MATPQLIQQAKINRKLNKLKGRPTFSIKVIDKAKAPVDKDSIILSNWSKESSLILQKSALLDSYSSRVMRIIEPFYFFLTGGWVSVLPLLTFLVVVPADVVGFFGPKLNTSFI